MASSLAPCPATTLLTSPSSLQSWLTSSTQAAWYSLPASSFFSSSELCSTVTA